MSKLIVIGGGAAGFFTAITAATYNPDLDITILEGSNKVLAKVLVSGGGRCNVTHNCMEPEELITFYPRGHEDLLPAFKEFNCRNTIEWFHERGVILKTEEDGRIFPITDSSETIANCLMESARKLGVFVALRTRATGIEQFDDQWKIHTTETEYLADYVMVASGGNINMWQSLDNLDIELVPPVPSLFTFDAHHPLLDDHSGLSFDNCIVSIPKLKQSASGPLLITHRGLSGPGILKLSAWAARELYEMDYAFNITVNWCGLSRKEAEHAFKEAREASPKQYPIKNPLFGISRRFWDKMCTMAGITDKRNWSETGKKQLNPLLDLCCGTVIQIDGKSTFKEEFVTAGGINLNEIDLTSFGVKRYPGLYAAGEVLNIDAVTGGFNFQAAWTGGFLAGKSIGLASIKEN